MASLCIHTVLCPITISTRLKKKKKRKINVCYSYTNKVGVTKCCKLGTYSFMTALKSTLLYALNALTD